MEPFLEDLDSGTVIGQVLATGLFNAFDAIALRDLETELRWMRLAAGGVLFRQGDAGDSMYVLVHGRLRITVEHADGTYQVIDELDPGVSVGETALLTGQPRSATVAAIDDVALLQLSGVGFDRLAAKNPAAMVHFAQAVIPRLRRTQVAGILTNLFGDLSAAALHEVETHLEWRHLANNEVLFRQGDPGDGLFVVINGRLNIVTDGPDGSRRLVGEISRGESIGEADVVTGETRTSTVYAIRDTDVVRLSKDSFDLLVDHYPKAMSQIMRMIMKRARLPDQTAARQAISVRTFAVVPAGDDAPLTEFCRRLSDALAVFGPTLHLNSARFDRLFGKPGSAQTSDEHPTRVVLTNWLSDQETRYRYIVYEADPVWSPWTGRCVRQADRVLAVGCASADPRLSAVEAELRRLEVVAREELVLLHAAGARRANGTRHWLSARPAAAHHHLRLAVDGDMHRLARRLTGRALGLVLGGGGGRGFAHLGVLRALEDAKIPIDLVGGTSTGAVIGALYAMGMDYADILDAARSFATRKQLLDFTVPFASFFASSKLTQSLQAAFGDAYIEDLWCPYFCTSSNLTRATAMVHRQGLLWKYVRASCALPGVFSPIVDQGDLLVDGAIMNNVPIDVMRELSEGGPVIAASVSTEIDPGSGYDFGPSISGWRILWNRLNPFATPTNVPSIFATILRSVELYEVHQQRTKRALADVFIYPPVASFSTLDFDRREQLIEIGYETARAELAAWLAAPERQVAIPPS